MSVSPVGNISLIPQTLKTTLKPNTKQQNYTSSLWAILIAELAHKIKTALHKLKINSNVDHVLRVSHTMQTWSTTSKEHPAFATTNMANNKHIFNFDHCSYNFTSMFNMKQCMKKKH
jgi:hypothetical protein